MTTADCALPGCEKAARDGEATCFAHRRCRVASSGSWLGEGDRHGSEGTDE